MARALQLQRVAVFGRWPLRGLPGRRRGEGGDALLPDVYVPCDICHGQRYNRETLEVQWKGKNIAQILELTVEDAAAYFQDVPTIARKLQTLLDVGLSTSAWARRPPRSRAARRSA